MLSLLGKPQLYTFSSFRPNSAILRLQEETAKVEDHLLHDRLFTTAITASFTQSKSHYFENLLDPLQKLLRLSPPLASSMSESSELFSCIMQKLSTQKPAVRVNLLRIVRDICDATEEGGGLLATFGLLNTIRDLELNDPAVLVRNMAQELIRSCEESEAMYVPSSGGGKKRGTANSVASSISSGVGIGMRRTSSSTTPPHLLERQMSMPSSPAVERNQKLSQQHLPHRSSVGYFDGSGAVVELRVAQTPRRSRPGVGNSGTRPGSTEGRNGSASPAYMVGRTLTSTSYQSGSNLGSGSTESLVSVGKSRLPRTTTPTTGNGSVSSRYQPSRSGQAKQNSVGVSGDRSQTGRNKDREGENGRTTPTAASSRTSQKSKGMPREKERDRERERGANEKREIAARRTGRRQTSAGEMRSGWS